MDVNFGKQREFAEDEAEYQGDRGGEKSRCRTTYDPALHNLRKPSRRGISREASSHLIYLKADARRKSAEKRAKLTTLMTQKVAMREVWFRNLIAELRS